MMSGGVNHHAQHNGKSFLVVETEAQRHEASCLGLHRPMVPEAGVEAVFPLDLQPTGLAIKSSFLSVEP